MSSTLVAVIFDRVAHPYQPGDIAAFSADRARAYVRSGAAHYADGAVRAVPSARAGAKSA